MPTQEMQPWYKATRPRKEVREGRSFHPDEFAIALEQVVAGTAPEDYRLPDQFFSRTYFTSALREHAGMVLRRLAGQTENTAPVLSLITQFGGGKTHTLTVLYHLVRNAERAREYSGVPDLLRHASLPTVPKARVAVFVGNAWDPQPGRETPWIDIARQLGGDYAVAALGACAETVPPGTEALGRIFAATNEPVLILFDEVLNFINRHRQMADQFYAFLQNLTVAMTGTRRGAVVVSLPRSQVEMTESDWVWQNRMTKVVKRVAQSLITNDESEISEVVRRRLFDQLGDPGLRAQVAELYAGWCFEHRAELPMEWTMVDSVATEASARGFLRRRFEACYPFHPATLSVFQRKWQAVTQYQQTRGTLAMLAQWVHWAYLEDHRRARPEVLITLGSAPLEVPDFRAVVLSQLGEMRLQAALEADIWGAHSHARALDADTKGPLRDIHRRTGMAILFESSGGQVEKVAHLPELRFALGEPEVDTTSIDNAAMALEARGFFVRRVGSDGFRVGYQATLKKVVSDRRASLDPEGEVRPAIRALVRKEFERGPSLPLEFFPADGSAVADSAHLALVVADPEWEWLGAGSLREQVAAWTAKRGTESRSYPGALVWCLKKPGRDLRDKVEIWLAWRRVAAEADAGVLGADFERADRAEVQSSVAGAEQAAKDEVWGGYRFAVLGDSQESGGLKVIDLGAGHASSAESLSGRVLAALKSQGLLNETVGAGYIERHWPPALKESGAWPLLGLRQSFLNGALTRLLDPDAVLRRKAIEFVANGDFGLASGKRPDGTYDRVWFGEQVPSEEVAFESDVYLLTRAKAEELRGKVPAVPGEGAAGGLFRVGTQPSSGSEASAGTMPAPDSGGPAMGAAVGPGISARATGRPDSGSSSGSGAQDIAGRGGESNIGPVTVSVKGPLPGEMWNRLGTKLIPKLRSLGEPSITVDFSVIVRAEAAEALVRDLKQAVSDLNLGQSLQVISKSEE